jgi:2,5-diamino-6-(ribosylamino)-4(3H)-pyrimidinone 5'-phosphate reductase
MCRVPKDALVLNDAAKTLIITVKGNERHFDGEHIEVVGCDADKNGQVDVAEVMTLLYRRGVRKLLVEGGGTVIWNFLEKKFVDDFYIYVAPCIIGGAKTPTVADGVGIRNENEVIPLTIVDVKRLGPGLLVHYQPS